MEAADRELTKTINQFNILNTIRKAGLISRVEIAELTGQSRAAVTNITARLIKEKMIFEKETKTDIFVTNDLFDHYRSIDDTFLIKRLNTSADSGREWRLPSPVVMG